MSTMHVTCFLYQMIVIKHGRLFFKNSSFFKKLQCGILSGPETGRSFRATFWFVFTKPRPTASGPGNGFPLYKGLVYVVENQRFFTLDAGFLPAAPESVKNIKWPIGDLNLIFRGNVNTTQYQYIKEYLHSCLLVDTSHKHPQSNLRLTFKAMLPINMGIQKFFLILFCNNIF